MEEYIKWLERKIEISLENKDLQREHWAFCQSLKKYREFLDNTQNYPKEYHALSDDEMDGTTEVCEPERCLYCDMNGPLQNGWHVIGCPHGILS